MNVWKRKAMGACLVGSVALASIPSSPAAATAHRPAEPPAALAPNGPPPPSPADPADPIADQSLRASVAAALGARPVRGEAVANVPVEVLTGYGDAVADTIAGLGGRVTGSVPGEVVQASVPAD